MNLILIRHGIAEDRDLGKLDAERELTARGRQELEKNVAFLISYLQKNSPRLISSPLCRAMQTAEILSQAGLGDIQVMDFAATGDLKALKEAILAQPERTLVIVGHSPHLEDWTYEMTERSLILKKGAALEIEITDQATMSGLVKWVLPAKKFDRLLDFESIQGQKEQFSRDIEEVVVEYIEEIMRYRESYLREPGEIESVHKLRVKIRQFRSLISFFKPLMSHNKQKRIQNVLRTMAQECAYLRELDVLIKEWQALQGEFHKAGLSGEAFLAVLRRERQSEERRLYCYLEKPEFARILQEKKREILSAIQPDRTLFIDLDGMVQQTLRQWHQEIRAGYEAIDSNDLAVIHALRIRAKKMRYLMEIFGLNEAPDSKDIYKQIKSWQEVLGDLTDANRNSEAVLEIAAKFPAEPIETEIRLFIELQARRAVTLYQEFFRKSQPDLNGADQNGADSDGAHQVERSGDESSR